jgi:hypothetical protein
MIPPVGIGKRDVRSFVDKANRERALVNALANLHGDDYVQVNWSTQGVSLRTDIDAIASRMPKGGGTSVIGATVIRFHITGSASGGGKYNARSYSGIPTVGESSTLSTSDIGTAASADDLLACNLQERDQATHDLSTSRLPLEFIGLIVPGQMSDHSPPRRVVWFNGIQSKACPS